jgi:hypothetical protein
MTSMKNLILLLILLQPLNILCQDFESLDTDTLYSISDFAIKNYKSQRYQIKKEKDDILLKRIKKITTVYTYIFKNGKESSSIFKSYFDSNGYKLKEDWLNNNTTHRTYKYDSWDNCVEELVYNADNILIEKKIREFDMYGNQIFNYCLKNGVEKTDLTNEILPNGNRIIKDVSEITHNTYIFNKNGVLLDYTMSFKNYPVIKSQAFGGEYVGVEKDTTFLNDNGDYQKTEKFIYDKNKLIKIESYEYYIKNYTKITYTNKGPNTYSIDTISWIDTGGLSHLQLFKYSDNLLFEKIDSSIEKTDPIIRSEPETYKTYYLYDRSENIIQKKLYSKLNRKDTLIKVINAKYDNNKNIISKNYYVQGFRAWEKNYSYNKQGKLTYYIYGGEKPITEIYKKYDSSGFLLEYKLINYTCLDCDEIDENENNSFPRIHIIKYNKFGNPIEISVYQSQNILIEKTSYDYSNTQLISENQYKGGVKIKENEFKYDSRGNLVFELIHSITGQYDTKFEYQYEFY